MLAGANVISVNRRIHALCRGYPKLEYFFYRNMHI